MNNLLDIAASEATQEIASAVAAAAGDVMRRHGNDPNGSAIVAAGFAMAHGLIAEWLYRHGRECHPGDAQRTASDLIALLLSADEPVRLELAERLNPWRPIETAPKINQQPVILYWKGRRPMEGFWYGVNGHEWYASNLLTPSYAPSHWLPLPSPPSEDKTP